MQLFEETAIETVLWGWITRDTCLLWCLVLCSENAQAFQGNTHFCMNTSMNCVVRTNQLKMILCSLDGNGIKLYKSFWYVSPNCNINLHPYHMTRSKSWGLCSQQGLFATCRHSCQTVSELFHVEGSAYMSPVSLLFWVSFLMSIAMIFRSLPVKSNLY